MLYGVALVFATRLEMLFPELYRMYEGTRLMIQNANL